MDGLNPIPKINLAILISGRGSNLQSIIDACRIPDFPAKINVIIADKQDAYGLVRAENNNIPTRIVLREGYQTKSLFEKEILSIINEFHVDLICLAGFMRILSPDFISPWAGRIINIHPSLLPKYKGLHTHERSIQAKDTESGCTVHFVTAGMDEGEIILQKTVPIMPTDTPETLAKRILVQEHIAYPEAIRILSETKL